MKKLLLILSCLICLPVSGQILIIGRDARDKVLPAFWAAGTNARTTIQGLNDAAPIPFTNTLLPTVISGKELSGDIVGTNVFRLKTWDATLGSFQVFDFNLTNGVGGPYGVIRSTGAESLTDKTLDDFVVKSNAVTMSGILKGYGSDPVGSIVGVAGTQQVLVQVDSSYSTPTNYLEFKEGVFTLNIASTNRLASVFWVTNYVNQLHEYGQLYTHDGVGTVSLTSAGTYYKLTIATAGPSLAMTVGTSSNALTVATAGTYECSFQVSFTGDTGSTFEFGAFTNGVHCDSIESAAKLANNDLVSISGVGFLELGAGGYVDLRVTSDSASDTIAIKQAQLCLKRID